MACTCDDRCAVKQTNVNGVPKRINDIIGECRSYVPGCALKGMEEDDHYSSNPSNLHRLDPPI